MTASPPARPGFSLAVARRRMAGALRLALLLGARTLYRSAFVRRQGGRIANRFPSLAMRLRARIARQPGASVIFDTGAADPYPPVLQDKAAWIHAMLQTSRGR